MKTLKREEIYANDYRDLEHLLGNVEAFIEQYYNRCRYIRHWAIGRRKSSSEKWSTGERPNSRPPTHRSDESPSWLFLGELLSSRAHLRFTNRASS